MSCGSSRALSLFAPLVAFGVAIFMVLGLVAPGLVFAKEPPQRGLLGSAGSVNYANLSIPQPFEGSLSGGVSISNAECSWQVSNTSKDDTIRASVEARAFNKEGRPGRSTNRSLNLAPGQSESGSFNMGSTTRDGCTLWVTRWRVTKSTKKEEEKDGKEGEDMGRILPPSQTKSADSSAPVELGATPRRRREIEASKETSDEAGTSGPEWQVPDRTDEWGAGMPPG